MFLVREEASGCKSRGRVHCPLGDCPRVLAFTGPSALFRAQRCSRKDIYQPPLAADIEKMKTTHLKEQKAFAFIREILGRQPRSPTAASPLTACQHRPEQTMVQSLTDPRCLWACFPKYQLTPASPLHLKSLDGPTWPLIKSTLPTVAPPTLSHLL